MQNMPPINCHIEVPHVEDRAAPPRGQNRKCLFQQLVEHFLERCAAPVPRSPSADQDPRETALRQSATGSASIHLRLVGRIEPKPLLNASPNSRRLGAELVVGELLNLRFKRINRRHARGINRLISRLVLRPKNLAPAKC